MINAPECASARVCLMDSETNVLGAGEGSAGGGATKHMQIKVVQGPEANHSSEPLVPIVEVTCRHGY